MKILDDLLQDALKKLQDNKESLRIDNIILGKSIYTMKSSSHVFKDMNLCLVLLENASGFSYFQEDIDFELGHFVNQLIPEVVSSDSPGYFKVALVDALYSIINREKIDAEHSYFEGNLRDKARQRAEALLSTIPSGAKVLLVGAATEIIEEARRRNIQLTVTDLEPTKIGLVFHDTRIENGKSHTFDKIKEVEYIISSGMIFASETADKIFELANKHNVKLILYMETGSNFGPQLLEYGAFAVLSEYFPFYDFFGQTRYSIFKK